jgi:hypothetical protein
MPGVKVEFLDHGTQVAKGAQPDQLRRRFALILTSYEDLGDLQSSIDSLQSQYRGLQNDSERAALKSFSDRFKVYLMLGGGEHLKPGFENLTEPAFHARLSKLLAKYQRNFELLAELRPLVSALIHRGLMDRSAMEALYQFAASRGLIAMESPTAVLFRVEVDPKSLTATYEGLNQAILALDNTPRSRIVSADGIALGVLRADPSEEKVEYQAKLSHELGLQFTPVLPDALDAKSVYVIEVSVERPAAPDLSTTIPAPRQVILRGGRITPAHWSVRVDINGSPGVVDVGLSAKLYRYSTEAEFLSGKDVPSTPVEVPIRKVTFSPKEAMFKDSLAIVKSIFDIVGAPLVLILSVSNIYQARKRLRMLANKVVQIPKRMSVRPDKVEPVQPANPTDPAGPSK